MLSRFSSLLVSSADKPEYTAVDGARPGAQQRRALSAARQLGGRAPVAAGREGAIIAVAGFDSDPVFFVFFI